ncbi:hypothetical protein V2J09_020964 [Rumex salicifolius]
MCQKFRGKMAVMLLYFFYLFITSPVSLAVNQEGLFLQQAKLSLDDPDGNLASWNSRDSTPCIWNGVICDGAGNVVSLDLSNFNLAGAFPTVICRLPRLSSVVLYYNNFNGTLPSSISDCTSMSHIDLSYNLFTGELPDTLPDLPSLRYLDLSGNNFSGDVPLSFGKFKRLEVVSLMNNLLDGPFPELFADVSTLRELNLTSNPFRPGRLSPKLGNLTNLERLWISNCNLVGEIPDSLSRLSKLATLDMSANGLTGKLRSSLIAGLTSIVQIELYTNNLTGELPSTGWANLTSLRQIDVSMNQLTGTIPDELTRLPLASLNLYENRLEGQLPASIANSPNLVELKVFGNRLHGELPRNLGENSPLNMIDVTGNLISGPIPSTLCAKGRLEQLLLLNNSFSGEIPATLAQCWTLERVRLGNNNLSGDVPIGFWGLPHVSLLELLYNSLTGTISKAIASASNLSELTISNNQFSGQIPEEFGSLNNLLGFQASDNQFSGPLPASIVQLADLGLLDLHNNQLSGELPSGFASLKKLNELNLANNAISGEIPAQIGSLPVLNYLDFSGNQFSGKVPSGVQNLRLNELNLSNNHLSGPLPPFFAKPMYKSSFLGNPGLCGEITGLCDSNPSKGKNRAYVWMLIFSLAALVLILGLAWFYFRYRSFKHSKSINDRSKWTLMSFHKLGFNEYEILDSLDEDNVIGSGASGKVYKSVLSNGEAVAVKKISTHANLSKESEGDDCDIEKAFRDDGFEAEVDTLGKIRHKNIVKLWCCCVAKDCKLLVYEYMPNGSLGDLLHSSKGWLLLDWPTRCRIALDAAEGLSYLHHDCVPPIVHRDIKSNNILLDGEFGARVADFGVAKAVEVIAKGTKSMSVIAGSCGYIAPEYAYTLRVNEKSDIYSFGVVILELVTGKLPVDPGYGDKDLVKWVCTTLDQKGVDDILDPKLDSCFKEEMCKVLNIGLVCTSPLPINRPSMRRVVKMLQEACIENQSNAVNKDGKLTPYYYEEESLDQVV